MEKVVKTPPKTPVTEKENTSMDHQQLSSRKSQSPIFISGKNGTPDRLKVPKAFKYPERYTSPTDQMMSPVTRGLLARSRKSNKLLPPSLNQPMIQALQHQEVVPFQNSSLEMKINSS